MTVISRDSFSFWVLNLKNTFGVDFGCLEELGALVAKFKILTFSPALRLSVKTFSTLRRRGREVAEKNKDFFFLVLTLAVLENLEPWWLSLRF